MLTIKYKKEYNSEEELLKDLKINQICMDTTSNLDEILLFCGPCTLYTLEKLNDKIIFTCFEETSYIAKKKVLLDKAKKLVIPEINITLENILDESTIEDYVEEGFIDIDNIILLIDEAFMLFDYIEYPKEPEKIVEILSDESIELRTNGYFSTYYDTFKDWDEPYEDDASMLETFYKDLKQKQILQKFYDKYKNKKLK